MRERIQAPKADLSAGAEWDILVDKPERGVIIEVLCSITPEPGVPMVSAKKISKRRIAGGITDFPLFWEIGLKPMK
ncbi:hypothetical protein [Aquiflexum sp.]|uniref:hypothetical protein n=1 Tax=Aquiflexum sp. TaxID=1872584 RepID=UPI003593DF18